MKHKNVAVRIIALLCVIALAFSVSACAKKDNKDKNLSVTEPSSVSEYTSSEELPVEEPVIAPAEKRLEVTCPVKKSITVNEPNLTLSGSSDPQYPLLINGQEVQRSADGTFLFPVTLNRGNNTFKFEHKGETATYTVNYNYVIAQKYWPSGKQYYESGSTFAVGVSARAGSRVFASFNGKTITLQKTETQDDASDATDDSIFTDFVGYFNLPGDNASDLDLGKVGISIDYDGVAKSFFSGNIICKKANIPMVAEIVNFTAETFNGDSNDDWSRPTNNYLPKGTVDYVTGYTYGSGKEYINLRYGKRVYSTTKMSPGNINVQIANVYAGSLPDHNEINVASVEQSQRFTNITLDCMWKAPFLLDFYPQSYTNPGKQDYTVSAVTCTYIDITFCYATKMTGSLIIPADNPVFSGGSYFPNGNSTVLRLSLKRTGEFYGWSADYNSAGQLVFTFLHPAKVAATSANKYGADLTGVKIALDVGHGGIDPGAVGPAGYESNCNLRLANALKPILESLGAAVIMDRTGDQTVNSNERCYFLRAQKPDLCVAIHHDSAGSTTSANGFGCFHSTLFSRKAALCIYNSTLSSGIYQAPGQSRTRFQWHYYYTARMTDCPVVLTENGFMSGNFDSPIIADYAGTFTQKKAEYLAQGIVNYFLSIQ